MFKFLNTLSISAVVYGLPFLNFISSEICFLHLGCARLLHYNKVSKGPSIIFSIFTSVQSVLLLLTHYSYPKAYYKNVDVYKLVSWMYIAILYFCCTKYIVAILIITTVAVYFDDTV